MNRIIKRELIGNLKYKNTVVLKYKIEYAEITGSNYQLGRNLFNKYNKQKALELEERAKTTLFKEASKQYDYNKTNDYPIMVYEVFLQYNITFNQSYIVSLYYDQYEFTGGAHGNTIRTSQNWDLRTGKQIPLQYFYPNNPYYVLDILREINKQIKGQIQSGNNYYFDDYCELVLDTFNLDNYYLNPDSIAIFFQQYDIAPYSSGIPVFYLPFKD